MSLFFGMLLAWQATTGLSSSQAPPIRTTVPLVVFPASVTDRQGQPIAGLTASDFVLLDNGKPQRISVDASDISTAPAALAVLVQTNDFAKSALGKIRKVGTMIPDAVVGMHGVAAIITYDQQVAVQQEFTADTDQVAEAFWRLPESDEEDAHMLDALTLALRLLASRPSGERQCILVIGQNRDRGSESKLKDVLDRLDRSGITVYGMSFSSFLTAFTTKASEYQPPVNGSYLEGLKQAARLGKKNTLAALVAATGGQEYGFETKGKLENDLIALGRDLHSRYLLSFTPDYETNPSFHQLELRVKTRAEAKIRARPGYWTVK